jgi:hypothetical protein
MDRSSVMIPPKDEVKEAQFAGVGVSGLILPNFYSLYCTCTNVYIAVRRCAL